MLQGILRKQERGILKRFKKRWFIISEADNYLRYYAAKRAGGMIGEIDLGSVIDVRTLTDDKGHKDSPFGFQVTTRTHMQEKALLLFAQTNEERKAWCDVINSKIEHLKRKASLTLQTLSQPIPVVQFPSSPSTRLYSTHNEPRTSNKRNNSNSNNNNNNNNNNNSINSSYTNSIENGSSNSTPALSPRMSESREGRHKLARSHSFDHSKVITFQSPTPLTTTISISSDDEIGTRRNSNHLNNNNNNNANNNNNNNNNNNTINRERNNTININNSNNNSNSKLSYSGGGGTSKNTSSSFAQNRTHSKTHIASPPTHMRKKSGGRIQEEINEYIKMSIWLQRQETVQKDKDKERQEKRDSQKEKQDQLQKEKQDPLQKEKENIVVEERVRGSM